MSFNKIPLLVTKFLQPLLAITALLLASLVSGALLSYPLYLLINLGMDYPIDKAIKHASILSGFMLSSYALKHRNLFNKQAMGLSDCRQKVHIVLQGLLMGVFIMAIVEVILIAFDIHISAHNYDENMNKLFYILMSSLFVGLIVAVIEEVLFRGLIISYLQTITTPVYCIVYSALLYAALHFLSFPEASDSSTTGWLSGLYNLPVIFQPISDLANVHSFTTLFALGLLLAIYRLHDAHVYYCIGVHAGLVALLKVSRKLTDFNKDNSFEFLVSPVDKQLGLLASLIVLCFIIPAFIKLTKKADASLM